jgi:uncharacterized membrane protein
MAVQDYDSLSDQELLVEKKKLKKSKLFHGFAIGFLVGILLFGFGAWLINPERKIAFLIPMFIPVTFIYKAVRGPNKNRALEEVLRRRKI